jgi:hypothetical protein
MPRVYWVQKLKTKKKIPFILCIFYIYFRIIGLCLLQNEMCPLFLNRHVLKFILGRKIGWHDLAFFDPVMYERLRQLVLDSQKKDASLLFTRYEFMCGSEPRIGKCGVITEFMHILSFFVVVFFVFVLCTLCCQFLWIVHYWLPLRFSLTFIYYQVFQYLC